MYICCGKPFRASLTIGKSFQLFRENMQKLKIPPYMTHSVFVAFVDFPLKNKNYGEETTEQWQRTRFVDVLSQGKMFFTFAAYILDILVDVFFQSILNSMNSRIYNWDRSLQKFFFPNKPALNSQTCTVPSRSQLGHFTKKKSRRH